MGKRYVICPRCEGAGRHVNPAVDGNGLTADDIDELGSEFLEDYLGGVYDVACERCHGERVLLACEVWAEVIGRCNEPVEEGYTRCYEHLTGEDREDVDSIAEMWAMEAAERKVGA